MKAAALIINFFIPGIGSMVIGKVGQGIAQLILWIIGIVLSAVLIGIPLVIGAWIWGLVTAASYQDKPMTVIVQQQAPPGN